jgi:hypothetical protein
MREPTGLLRVDPRTHRTIAASRARSLRQWVRSFANGRQSDRDRALITHAVTLPMSVALFADLPRPRVPRVDWSVSR